MLSCVSKWMKAPLTHRKISNIHAPSAMSVEAVPC
jgi:hypothetical protein